MELEKLKHESKVLMERINLFDFTVEGGFSEEWRTQNYEIRPIKDGSKCASFTTQLVELDSPVGKMEAGVGIYMYEAGNTAIVHTTLIDLKGNEKLTWVIEYLAGYVDGFNGEGESKIFTIDNYGSTAISISACIFNEPIDEVDNDTLLDIINKTSNIGTETIKRAFVSLLKD